MAKTVGKAAPKGTAKTEEEDKDDDESQGFVKNELEDLRKERVFHGSKVDTR